MPVSPGFCRLPLFGETTAGLTAPYFLESTTTTAADLVEWGAQIRGREWAV